MGVLRLLLNAQNLTSCICFSVYFLILNFILELCAVKLFHSDVEPENCRTS